METYNKNVMVEVDTVQQHVTRYEKLMSLKGPQPASLLLCIILPIVIDGLKMFVLVLTKGWWVKWLIKGVQSGLQSFYEDSCKTKTDPTQITDPLKIV